MEANIRKIAEKCNYRRLGDCQAANLSEQSVITLNKKHISTLHSTIFNENPGKKIILPAIKQGG